MNNRQHRDAMARLATAVSVVTTDGPAGRGGFTASAVCSVSDDPPSILVCMNRGSNQHDMFVANRVLCVNILSDRQQAYSVMFSGPADRTSDGRFIPAEWNTMTTGAPALLGTTASLDCGIDAVSPVGTHSVLFCRVRQVRIGSARSGLVYFDRDYRRLTDLSEGATSLS